MLDRLQRPIFRRGEGRVDIGFTQIDLAAVAELFGETVEQAVESAGALPELKRLEHGARGSGVCACRHEHLSAG